MNQELKEWLTTIINEEETNAVQVGEIVSDYFGEELVDVQIPDVDETINRVLHDLPIQSLVVPQDSNEDTVTLVDYEDNLVIISRQVYFDNCSKCILDDNIESLYIPLVKRSIERTILHFIASLRIPIIIRFPRVRVTNENDKFIDITELYAKVDVKSNGKLAEFFTLMRTEYTMVQWESHYSHSHMPSTEFRWQSPCLGSGPILGTQESLFSSFNLDIWGLFCYELSKYVTVESLAGVPYRRLENVGNGNNLDPVYNQIYFSSPRFRGINTMLSTFWDYFIREFNFPLSFINGAYALGDSVLNFAIHVTDLFANWYNKEASMGHYTVTLEEFKSRSLLVEVIIKDGKIYSPRRENSLASRVPEIQGRELFEFKGKMVTANFTGAPEEDGTNNTVLLLNGDIISFLISRILRIINYKYGEHQDNSDNSGSEEVTTNKKYLFI